jgi:hypothetical protein
MTRENSSLINYKDLPSSERYHIVDTGGTVLQTGDGFSGVVIVAEETETVVMIISEVSDDTIINLFLSIPDEAGVMKSEVPREPGETWLDGATHEILLNREN